jgi:pimeloyl-ACP methyl ester carboxylesterase
MVRPLLFVLLLLALWPALPAASHGTLVEGQIGGAAFAIARPSVPWNGRLVLQAHGYRSEKAPLVADLFIGHAAIAKLLSEGWMVAKTSYRRNGIILDDAIADLDALRQHIADTYGRPRRVLLEGDSMGGAIVTRLAERGGSDYHGAVAVGAALEVREPGGSAGVTFQPTFPVLFLTNQTELEGPRGYVQRATALATLDRSVVAPVLFRVSRDGHVNVNQAERLLALRALDQWLDAGRESLPPPTAREGVPGAGEFYDATIEAKPTPSQVIPLADGRGFTARVEEISAIYGNAGVNAQPGDFAAAGIAPGSYFQLTAGELRFRVRYGRDFSSVERGQWVMFPNADGTFWLARNMGNAAESANLAAGASVQIERYPAP